MTGLPAEVDDVLTRYRTAELTTLTGVGEPVTWPTAVLWRPAENRFVLTTSIGMARKASNVRRDPRVSLLFSDPTGSGARRPLTVLVQGEATCDGIVRTGTAGMEDYWRRIFAVQPKGRLWGATGLGRRWFDWYYMRLHLFVTPRRITWWDGAGARQERLEVGDHA